MPIQRNDVDPLARLRRRSARHTHDQRVGLGQHGEHRGILRVEGVRPIFAALLREYSKPMIIAANKADIAPKEFVDKLLAMKDETVIPVSGVAEIALRMAEKAGLIKYNPGDKAKVRFDRGLYRVPHGQLGAAVLQGDGGELAGRVQL